MSKNQLFRIPPDLSFVENMLRLFGLNGLDDTNYFTRDSITEINIIDKFNSITNDLQSYYLPCKYKVYVTNIDEKKCITILRQFLKLHNYTLISKEKYFNGEKHIIYRLIKLDSNKLFYKQQTNNKNIVITFE